MNLPDKLRDMADSPYKEADRHYLRHAAQEIERLEREIAHQKDLVEGYKRIARAS